MERPARQGILDLCANHRRTGRVEQIFVRPGRRVACRRVVQAQAIAGQGLDGDRSRGGTRQLSLIQHEHLAVIAALLGLGTLDPIVLRRNLVISGINLVALKPLKRDQVVNVRIGDAIIQIGSPCAPCSRMEEALGPGGYNALRGHGGVLASIIVSGMIREGSEVAVLGD